MWTYSRSTQTLTMFIMVLFIEKFVPFGNNYLTVFFYHHLGHFYFVGFEPIIFYKSNFGQQIKFRFAGRRPFATQNMDMNRLMVI